MARVTIAWQSEELGTLQHWIAPYEAQAPVTERLEFATNVITSYSGVEQRNRIRTAARQEIAINAVVQHRSLMDSYDTPTTGFDESWLVPCWHHAQVVGDLSASTGTAVPANTTGFEVNAEAALLYTPCNGWQVHEIFLVSSGLVTLATPVSADLPGAYLVPCYRGHLLSLRRQSSGRSSIDEYQFRTVKGLRLSEVALADQYNGLDVLLDEGLLDGGSSENAIEQRIEEIDYGIGSAERFSPRRRRNRTRLNHHVHATTPEEITALRRFVFRCAGRYREFYKPILETSFHLLHEPTDFLLVNFLVASDSLGAYEYKPDLAIKYTDGTWSTYEIASIVTNAGESTITVSGLINRSAGEIVHVCYLGKFRLGDDTIEFEWLTGRQVRCTLPMVELVPPYDPYVPPELELG